MGLLMWQCEAAKSNPKATKKLDKIIKNNHFSAPETD